MIDGARRSQRHSSIKASKKRKLKSHRQTRVNRIELSLYDNGKPTGRGDSHERRESCMTQDSKIATKEKRKVGKSSACEEISTLYGKDQQSHSH